MAIDARETPIPASNGTCSFEHRVFKRLLTGPFVVFPLTPFDSLAQQFHLPLMHLPIKASGEKPA
jgi:hypothetical protein